MPVALLLQDVFNAVRKGLARLTPFALLAELEETLIDRARGAFMVHWFGSSLPFEGRSVRAFIVNLDHLRRRYAAVQRAYQQPDYGPNLGEPLAGLVGGMVGIALSPTGWLTAAVVSIGRVSW